MVGLSCRTRVLKHLKGQFTLSEAEEHYGVNYFQSAPPVQAAMFQSPQMQELFTPGLKHKLVNLNGIVNFAQIVEKATCVLDDYNTV